MYIICIHLKVNYKLRMEKAKIEAKEERKKLLAEKARLEKEAKRKALEEEREKLEALKREAARKKKEMEEEKKRKAEEERRLRHEREEKERLERKRLKEEEEQKRLEEELKKNPNATIDDVKKKKKKKNRRKSKKKKDDWSDDKPWTPQRVLAAIHAEMSPYNWGLFKPSQKEVKPIKWGHGNLSAIREELKDDEVMYGLMRLSFGSGKFKRSHWVYFLWTPDSMTHEYKKGRLRMKYVSYNGEMQRLLAPWTVSLTVEHKEKVTIKDWIMRVKKTVVVDGADEAFSEEAFKKALEEERKYIEQLKLREKELKEKLEKEAEAQKIAQMKLETRRRKEKAEKQMSTEFTRLQLKQVIDSPMGREFDRTPTMDKDGNYLYNHDIDYSAIPDKKIEMIAENKEKENDGDTQNENENENDDEDEYEDSSDEDKPKEPSPEPVIELTEEELAILEEERKKKEAEEYAKRTENEIKYRGVLQSKMVLESVELCKRTGESLNWILFVPKPSVMLSGGKRSSLKRK